MMYPDTAPKWPQAPSEPSPSSWEMWDPKVSEGVWALALSGVTVKSFNSQTFCVRHTWLLKVGWTRKHLISLLDETWQRVICLFKKKVPHPSPALHPHPPTPEVSHYTMGPWCFANHYMDGVSPNSSGFRKWAYEAQILPYSKAKFTWNLKCKWAEWGCIFY